MQGVGQGAASPMVHNFVSSQKFEFDYTSHRFPGKAHAVGDGRPV